MERYDTFMITHPSYVDIYNAPCMLVLSGRMSSRASRPIGILSVSTVLAITVSVSVVLFFICFSNKTCSPSCSTTYDYYYHDSNCMYYSQPT